MTLPKTSTDPTPDFGALDRVITELRELHDRQQELMAERDNELRRLRREHAVSVSELRDRAGLSKSMVRLITTPPRGM